MMLREASSSLLPHDHKVTASNQEVAIPPSKEREKCLPFTTVLFIREDNIAWEIDYETFFHEPLAWTVLTAREKRKFGIKLLLREAASAHEEEVQEWQVESVWSASSCWHREHWWPCNVFPMEPVEERYPEIQGWKTISNLVASIWNYSVQYGHH